MHNLIRIIKKCKYLYRKWGLIYLIYSIGENCLPLFSPYFKYKRSIMRKKYFESLPWEMIKKEVEETYVMITGESLLLDSPVSLNEKIQWLKIYDITPLKIELSDKYVARDYIYKCVGETHMVKLLGVYDSFDDIIFDTLPESFVIKVSQGSGFNFIIKNKKNCNIRILKFKFKYWLKTDFRYFAFEYQYAKTPKIIIEEYLGEEILEYKFMCFSGEPEFFWVRSLVNGKLHRNYYDMNKNESIFHFGNAQKNPSLKLVPDDVYYNMVQDVKKLASPFKFVRVDTFVKDIQYYIGELTFTSGAGYDNWIPKTMAIKYGSMIHTEVNETDDN